MPKEFRYDPKRDARNAMFIQRWRDDKDNWKSHAKSYGIPQKEAEVLIIKHGGKP